MLTSSRDEFASNAEVGSSYVCGRDGRRMEQKGAKQPCINIIDTELVYISERSIYVLPRAKTRHIRVPRGAGEGRRGTITEHIRAMWFFKYIKCH